MRVPYILSAVLAVLMVGQSVLGRVYPGQYRDAQWIRLTWFGNDWLTLAVAGPLLVAFLLLVRGGSVRGLLLWLGVLGYGAYNYAYYMLGARRPESSLRLWEKKGCGPSPAPACSPGRARRARRPWS